MTEKPPVFIIGSGRSGTNMLRDLLAQLPGLQTWPCDEINYIWRHGNRAFATDEFSRAMATDGVARYIRRQFTKLKETTDAKRVLEKTCANSLRCEFVDEIFPSSQFIHIVRDGRDVAISAAQRWKAKLDPKYILKKARYVPPSDLPWYAASYFANRIRRTVSKDGRLGVWGPKFTGMEEAFGNHRLTVACSLQWQACVSKARDQLGQLPPERVMTLRYEDVADDPAEHIKRIGKFIDMSVPNRLLTSMKDDVSSKSVGRWRNELSEEDRQTIFRLIGETLQQFGYPAC